MTNWVNKLCFDNCGNLPILNRLNLYNGNRLVKLPEMLHEMLATCHLYDGLPHGSYFPSSTPLIFQRALVSLQIPMLCPLVLLIQVIFGGKNLRTNIHVPLARTSQRTRDLHPLIQVLRYFSWFVTTYYITALKGKGNGRLWVLQHCCLEAYCTLTRMSSFIHLQRRCRHQAPLLAKEETISGI